jgi:hypothetical protein
MTTQDIVIESIKLAGQIGIFTIASYWIQKQIDKSSQKRLEEFKTTLSLLSTKVTTLHNKRFKVIEEMYSRIVDLQISMLRLTNPIKFAEDYQKELEKLTLESNESFQNFNIYFEKNRFYFNDFTCGILEQIRKVNHAAIWDFNEHRIYEGSEVEDRKLIKEARQKMLKAYDLIKDEIPKLRESLDNDFKKILIVD